MVGEFNGVQRENGRKECCNGSSHNWLKSDRPKVAICPHQEDYCDTCSRQKAEMHSMQTTINRLLQSANALPDEIKKLQDTITELKKVHENHKTEAQQSHIFYTEITKQCAAKWNDITTLEEKNLLTRREKSKLSRLKENFTLVICADYQMCKLVPYWELLSSTR